MRGGLRRSISKWRPPRPRLVRPAILYGATEIVCLPSHLVSEAPPRVVPAAAAATPLLLARKRGLAISGSSARVAHGAARSAESTHRTSEGVGGKNAGRRPKGCRPRGNLRYESAHWLLAPLR